MVVLTGVGFYLIVSDQSRYVYYQGGRGVKGGNYLFNGYTVLGVVAMLAIIRLYVWLSDRAEKRKE
jgi:hypothetical protein